MDGTIEGLGRAIRDGGLGIPEVVEECLTRIRERDPLLHAWVETCESEAVAEAERLERELRSGRDRGALHGIPVGVKDLYDVRGMATRAGFKAWAEREPAQEDAVLVGRLREAGAVILGKTVTTSFAWVDPPATVNPWDASRTPGGSSSGSAAAVAAGMCPVALGSQTGGSIIRPAAYCGVVGFKPSYGRLPLAGVVPLAHRLDHAGYMTRSVRDSIAVWEALTGERVAGGEEDAEVEWFEVEDALSVETEAVVRSAIERALRRLRAEGLRIRQSRVTADGIQEARGGECEGGLQVWNRWHRTIMAQEAAEYHRELYREMGELYPPRIQGLVEEGLKTDSREYEHAVQMQEDVQQQVGAWGGAERELVMPATLDVAPGRETTGSPAWNSPWSFTGQPAITLPVGRSREGLPIGLQLVGCQGRDGGLLRHALWVEFCLGDLAKAEVSA